ncbi:type IV pilus modification PilV family protein [Microbacterium karelineae]|uniref:type IV pilus modification PilV family protein n=1 Tax=Microbacterium karelineae TaxID=2654283 RepID=UPI0012EA3CA0|nr:prepilin-type N-terminal cleavage/methylation domain-containing protein [Microbacterium karelineae]
MRARDDDGFTLVEAVVSIAIFAIVATAATFAIVSAVRAASATELRVAAGHIAEEELARVVSLGAEPAEPPGDAVVSDGGREFSVTVSADPAYGEDCAGGHRDVALEVTVAAHDAAGVSARLDTRLACEPEPAP